MRQIFDGIVFCCEGITWIYESEEWKMGGGISSLIILSYLRLKYVC